MAVAYESVATTTFTGISGGVNLNITKPTGLAAGDYLIAHLSVVDNTSGGAGTFNTPAGWTSGVNASRAANTNSNAHTRVFYKVADSSDAAAGSFNFTKDGTGANACGGALYRISGGSSIQIASDGVSDSATPSFSNTVTPTFASSLILFLVTGADASQASGTTSAYAITTSNPASWTEVYDFSCNLTSDRGVMAGAWASRPEVTATGNSTCTFSAHTQNFVGVQIIVNPVVNVTVSPSVITGTISVQAPSISGSANVSVSAIDLYSDIPIDFSVETNPSDWTFPAKADEGTWTYPTKT